MPPVRAPLLTACLAALALCFPALAEIAPPVSAPFIQITDFGIYCSPQSRSRAEAPETTLGYIDEFTGDPEFRFHQQEVPASIGVSFGVQMVSERDIPNARVETWKPGASQPDIWYKDIPAGTSWTRGFSFDFEEELILGLWRMETWDGDTRLYSVEFDVVAPSAQPGIGSDCHFLS